MKSNIIVISALIISICILFIVPNCYADDENENSELLHPALFYIIKYYSKSNNSFPWMELDSFQHKDYLSPLIKMENDSNNRFYIVIKFFKLYDNLYLTIWSIPCFPEYIKTMDGDIVNVDEDNMYYYELGNINLIIFDFPESIGYGLYNNNKVYNEAAVKKKKEYYENIEPILTNREPIYETFLLVKDALIRVKSQIPPKYENEISVVIIDDNIGIYEL